MEDEIKQSWQFSDAELVAGCIDEDPDARTQLFNQHFASGTTVYYWVYVGANWINSSDKEDILNDIYVAVLQSLPSFQFKSTVTTYISRIAKMKCLDAMPSRMGAAKGKGVRFVDADERNEEGDLVHQVQDSDQSNRPDSFFDELDEQRQVHLLHRALSDYSGPRCRETLSLYVRELNNEISRQELAESLGVSLKRAQNMIYDCLYRIRRRIQRSFRDYTEFAEYIESRESEKD
jgi:RNA polymerase sigma factor (sigma-70 family)